MKWLQKVAEGHEWECLDCGHTKAETHDGDPCKKCGYEAPKNYVAQIGEQKYESLAEALEAAQANEQTGTVTVTLLADVEFEGDDLYADMILDLNGKTITATGSYVFWFEGGSLTIQDSSAEKTGMIDGSETVGNAFLLMGEESLTIESGKIHANNNVIYAYGSGATVTINGGELKSYIGTGNLFYLVGANDTITVNGGTFLGNVTPYAAGLIIKGGVFSADVNAYCAANHGAVLNGDGLYEIVPLSNETAVAQIGDKYYLTLGAAINAAGANDTILVLKDVTEELPTLKGKIVPANDSVTITATNTDWLYLPDAFEIGEGVTLNIPYHGMFVYYNVQAVIKGHVVTDAVYLAYPGTKLTVCEPGSLTVTGESFIIRGMEGDVDSGLYIVGDNNDATIGLKADVIYFYQGTVSAKDANIQVSVFWQTQETDGVGSANLILDNTKMNVTVGEQIFKATGNSTVTLTNGSQVSAAGGYNGVNVYMDDTSVFVHNSNAVFAAKANNVAYKTLAEAVEVAANGATITLLVDSDEDIALAKAIELKLNGKSYTGTITLAEGAALTAPEGLDVTTNVADHKVFYKDGAYVAYEKVELPQVAITDIKGNLLDSDPDLTFALNFAIANMDELTDEYLEKLFAFYGDYYTDYVLTISGLSQGSVTFNANGDADGYLAGQYDAWSENWVSVPFEDVTVRNSESLYIMEYAAKLMGKDGLRFTLAEVAAIVQNFDCGVYFTPEFLAANPDLKVSLELKVFTEDAEGNKIEDVSVATNNFDVENVAAIVVGEDKQTRYFDSFTAAVAAAEAGDTVIMLEDATLSGKLTMNKNITIDGNGHSIIADATAVWYTVSGKLQIKNYKTHLLGLNASGIELKNIVLDCNNNAAGINIYCAQDVVFDNVSIINATKGMAALTVNGSTLTVKNAFTALGNSIAIDASNGSGVTSALGVTFEDGTVVDLGNKTVKFASVATMDVAGAKKADGTPYFVAKDNAYFYTTAQIESRTTAFSNGLTLLNDVDLSAKTLTVKGNLNLNGYDLVVKELKVAGATTIIGGAVTAEKLTLTSTNATLTAPEGLNVTTTLEGYQVVCKDGVYTLIKAVASVNGDFYETFEEAWAAVQAGGTIKLLVDYNPNMITVFENVTLDLNGHTASAAYVVVFNGGHIVDNSESNAGRLVAGNLMINEKNAQLPVKTETGYMFADVAPTAELWSTNNNWYAAQFKIESIAHQRLMESLDAAEVSILVRISWTNAAGERRSQDFEYKNGLVNQFLNSYDPATGKYDQQITLSLIGTEGMEITYQVVVASDTGVEFVSGGIKH